MSRVPRLKPDRTRFGPQSALVPLSIGKLEDVARPARYYGSLENAAVMTGRINRAAIVAVWVAVALLLVSTCLCAQESGAVAQQQIAGLEVNSWMPPAGTPGPWPILIFSHGFHGCGTHSSFLLKSLAQDGYAVFAPNHSDSSCGGFVSWLRRPETPPASPENWNDETYSGRAQEIENLLDALLRDPRYKSAPFDLQQVGLIGHSLGGYTVLELAGAWPRWKDPRIKAVLALSPYTTPFISRHTLHGIDVPVMYQGGSRDRGITISLEQPGGAYEQTRAPKYLVEFSRAGHFAWIDSGATAKHALIDEYSRAFFDRYLKGKPFPHGLERPGPGVADLRFQQ
jgi:predicted dienelactone hydrolase